MPKKRLSKFKEKSEELLSNFYEFLEDQSIREEYLEQVTCGNIIHTCSNKEAYEKALDCIEFSEEVDEDINIEWYRYCHAYIFPLLFGDSYNPKTGGIDEN